MREASSIPFYRHVVDSCHLNRCRLEVNEALIRERHEAMVDIYKQLEEVNDIFKDLAKLVDEQTDDIIEISENVEVTHDAAKNALDELKTAQEIQKKSSCSMM